MIEPHRSLLQHYVARFVEHPLRAWLVSGAVGVVQVVFNDAFFWLWWILAAANLIDWMAGRWAARARRDFSRSRSREGLYSKALGLAVVAILRSMEAVLPAVAIDFSTQGALAAAIATALLIDELDSIDRHRQALGKGPIPLLSVAIDKVRAVTGAREEGGA